MKDCFFFKSRKQGQLIEITKDNQIYGYYSLNEDQIIKIDQENTIQIKNQKVKMNNKLLVQIIYVLNKEQLIKKDQQLFVYHII